MLISDKELRARYAKDRNKLETIMNVRHEAPQSLQVATNHLSNLGNLFTYSYHAAIVNKYLAPSKSNRILDWGAFVGQVTYLLQDEYNVEAYNTTRSKHVEYWHKALKIQHSSFSHNIVKPELPFTDKSFNAVISSGVLEHTFEHGFDELVSLKEHFRVLRDDGYLFIWHLPSTSSLTETIGEKYRVWRHIRRYTLHEILVMLARSGFEILAIERNELLFGRLYKYLLPITSIEKIWEIDDKLCHAPFLREKAHFFTIVAKKITDFPKNFADTSYSTYLS